MPQPESSTPMQSSAVEAAQSRGESAGPDFVPKVMVRLEQRPQVIRLTVDDNGPGFPPDRAKLFEPYVTTRDRGTGLGLSIVKKIIEEHGGRIRLEDAAPLDADGHRGARVVVTLPPASAVPGTDVATKRVNTVPSARRATGAAPTTSTVRPLTRSRSPLALR